MSRIIVHKKAAKYIEKLPAAQKERAKNMLGELEINPLEHPQVKHMVGEWAGYHRMRIGDIRVIFWFDETEDVIYIDHAGPRGDIYK